VGVHCKRDVFVKRKKNAFSWKELAFPSQGSSETLPGGHSPKSARRSFLLPP